jgi:hypothetical protein
MSKSSTQAQLHQFLQTVESLAELRGILKYHKVIGRTVTYVPVANAQGVFSGSSVLAGRCGEIQTEDYQKGEPFLCAMLVGSQTGIPGSGFFAHARKLGCKIGNDPVSEFLFWAGQMNALGVSFPAEAMATAAALGITEPQIAGA